MTRAKAIAGSAAFLIAAPGVVAGLIPWWLTGWEMAPAWLVVRLAGAVLILAGLAFLLHTFTRFALEGGGTPAPVAPTQRLVVGGAYRYVRNPMYLAVMAVILGQGLILWQPVLFLYAAIPFAAVVAFVRFYEEPTLLATYGASYEAYRAAVPGWIPRLTPWNGGNG
jgi:protein-S-isoprenylcysteine O-methyltransferase Ste14